MVLGFELLIALLVILAAAEIFTNALEHLGERIGISEGVTGSLFAAVGTALPESTVPVVAVIAGGANAELNAEIGVGAILGAPLMLSTLSLCVMALSVFARRGLHGHLRPERTGLQRDLTFFLVAFAMAFVALFVPPSLATVRAGLAIALVLNYFVYVMLTLRVSAQLVEDGHGTEAHGDLFLCRIGLPQKLPVIVAQMALGLALLIAGAKGFVYCVEHLSVLLGISPLLLALLIVPIATELPEKVNSVIWIRRGKDTLAFGNITGAMVFQGSLLPALGLTITPWRPTLEVVLGVLVTYGAALWLFWNARRESGGLRVWHLLVNGAIYVGYIGTTIALTVAG
ncbi:MAG TPA: sodium:calcium antiporter [Gammaproteobacteria bacterium]|nr:sodium:calcium antiporter [Gammaproteobacteria bacterium]